MGRRSDHGRDELRELALAEARAVVEAEGWRTLTARRLAAGLGYSVGTLYNLFADQDELLFRLNARTLDDLAAELEAAPARGDPEQDVRALLAAYLRFVAENRNRWAVLFEHHPPPGHPVPAWYRDSVARPLAIVEEALAPLFPASDRAAPGRAARVLWSGLHGILWLAGEGKLATLSGEPPEALAEGLVATFLAGLRAPASR